MLEPQDSTANPSSKSAATGNELAAAADLLLSRLARRNGPLRFGAVELVVHDGRLVQIERRERYRPPFANADPDRGGTE